MSPSLASTLQLGSTILNISVSTVLQLAIGIRGGGELFSFVCFQVGANVRKKSYGFLRGTFDLHMFLGVISPDQFLSAIVVSLTWLCTCSFKFPVLIFSQNN